MRLVITVVVDGTAPRYDAYDAIRRSLVVGADNATARFTVGDRDVIFDADGNRIGAWAVES